ncbi:MAG TPA: 50S ribosomal protein L16 [Candidatus Paceibacterota bacterium]|nr:50S ribosomal protein L16 [Candidatus Paceibacterota bacterium]
MLQPKRILHRKVHKGRSRRRTASRGTELSFGAWGLKAVEGDWLKASQLESARRVISRVLARGGKIWTRVFPDKPRTAKSSEVGMGGGTGSLSHFVAPVQAGQVLFELDGVTDEMARQALTGAGHKLPIKTRIIQRS